MARKLFHARLTIHLSLLCTQLVIDGSNPQCRITSYNVCYTKLLRVVSAALRFHPKCWHREEGQTKAIPRPALIAAVTDGAGEITGVHRTWLAPDGRGKAAVETPRRAT